VDVLTRKKTTRRRRLLPMRTLRVLLAEWQARLGLQGWVIHLQLVRASTFGDHDTLGDCNAMKTKRKASLRLLDGDDYEDHDTNLDDHETVLVHELLHLLMPTRLFGLKVDCEDLGYQLYEQGIDQLARALVALKRGA
jgi:hypothetical protein